MRTSFELSLDDTSPIINYYPFAETLGAPNLAAGWNSYFSESGFLSHLGETGKGQSLHVTSLDGAELTIQWFGTGISLHGSVLQAAYSISLDGQVQQPIGVPEGNLLAEFQGLDPGQHIVALVAHPSSNTSHISSSYVAFDHAILNVSTSFVGATVSSELINVGDSRWFFSDDWTRLSDPVLDSQLSQEYYISTSQGGEASISFTGSAVAVTGVRNTTTGHYNVTIDGTTTTFDGHSDWLEPSTLFLQAGLEEMSRHSLTVTNLDDASLAITGLNITHVNAGGALTSQGLSTGTTIALVFVGLAAFAAVSFLLVCVYIRRHRKRDRKPSFVIDPGLTAGAYFKNFTRAVSSRHRQSRHNKHEMSTFAHPTEQDRYISNVVHDSEALITAGRRNTFVDLASPTPYMRVPNASSHEQTYQTSLERQEIVEGHLGDSQQGQHAPRREILRRDTLDENRKNSRAVTHKSSKRSVSVDPPRLPRPNIGGDRPQLPRLDIGVGPPRLPRLDMPSPIFGHGTLISPAESANLEPSSRLLSHPSRGRRTSRRSSLGTGYRYSLILDTPSSINTMQFGLPGSEQSGSILVGRSASLASPPRGRVAGGSVEQSGTQKTSRHLASLQQP